MTIPNWEKNAGECVCGWEDSNLLMEERQRERKIIVSEGESYMCHSDRDWKEKSHRRKKIGGRRTTRWGCGPLYANKQRRNKNSEWRNRNHKGWSIVLCELLCVRSENCEMELHAFQVQTCFINCPVSLDSETTTLSVTDGIWCVWNLNLERKKSWNKNLIVPFGCMQGKDEEKK